MLWLLWLACQRPDPVDEVPVDTESPADTEVAPDPDPFVPDPLVLINEVQADNDSTIMDPSLAFVDWFELYNPGPADLDLSRVIVQRDGASWTGSGTLPARAHLMVWASSDMADIPGHAPFNLPQDEGTLELFVDGVLTDSLTWAALPGDTSIARIPDGRAWHTTARPTPGATNGSAPTATDDPSDQIFQTDHLTDVRIWLPRSSRDALNADPYTEVPCSMAFGGAWFPQVGIHIKGRWGSFRTLDQKSAFKIDLNAYADHRLRGLETLTLNNMVQDPTYIHEAITYELYRDLGLPAPRIGYSRVYVDDELFGLYLQVETIDDTFLRRWWANGDGPMWEGSYGTDFDASVDAFEYDEGPEIEDKTPLYEVRSLLDLPASPARLNDMAALVDVEHFFTYMAVEALSQHWDGYTTRNNYRVYHDPDTDLLTFLPWGTDQTWLGSSFGLYGAQGRLFGWLRQEDRGRKAYDQQLRRVAQRVLDMDLERYMDELIDFVGPAIPDDVRGHGDLGWFLDSVEGTRANLTDWPHDVLSTVPPP